MKESTTFISINMLCSNSFLNDHGRKAFLWFPLWSGYRLQIPLVSSCSIRSQNCPRNSRDEFIYQTTNLSCIIEDTVRLTLPQIMHLSGGGTRAGTNLKMLQWPSNCRHGHSVHQENFIGKYDECMHMHRPPLSASASFGIFKFLVGWLVKSLWILLLYLFLLL